MNSKDDSLSLVLKELINKQNKLMLMIATLLCLLLVLIIAIVLYTLTYKTSDTLSPHTPLDNRISVFQKSISDAALENSEAQVANLFALNKNNSQLLFKEINDKTYVKAVMWMSDNSFSSYYAEKSEAISPPINIAQLWMTLVPQVQSFCSKLSVEDPSFRLKQYLGLNPNRKYERFMEIWVEPSNVFRPCIDPEASDNVCQFTIEQARASGSQVSVSGIDDYPSFFERLKQASYSPSGAPWTRLGYTYDWAFNQRGVGASEYIMVPNTEFLIEANYSTDDYCAAN